jgi:hypothetical protein
VAARLAPNNGITLSSGMALTLAVRAMWKRRCHGHRTGVR